MLKYLRESRNKTKNEVYSDIISLPSARKLEDNCENIELGVLKKILSKLEITIEEFIYLCNNESYFRKIRKTKNFIDYTQIKYFLKIFRNNPKFFNTLKCIECIHLNKLSEATIYAKEVWKYLSEIDEMSAYDLFCLTHIFILFDDEDFKDVCFKIKKNFNKWRDFEDFYIVEIAFYLNLGRYLEEKKELEEALFNYQEALKFSKQRNLGSYTGISLFKVGVLTENTIFIEQSRTILKLFDPKSLELLIDDYKLYFDSKDI